MVRKMATEVEAELARVLAGGTTFAAWQTQMRAAGLLAR